ncbi:hypothetical protein NKW44_09095 [Acetobacter lovaniensis]|uniref:hypothetical protein n=1 Tax=Acetobacter lovaniensis TaxID=104100 RepID=UPI00209EF6A4|nr:hypothetical protein [Acetobacter lovaniensis]MCP1239849.1 hypothetical protein [Acetobacter lovaniensis]
MATAIATTNSPAVTPLVSAGETLFGTVTGKPLSDNVLKVTAGVTSLLDGMLPMLSAKVSFDLDGVLVGATEVLTGVNAIVAAAKDKAAPKIVPSTSSASSGGA